jgi:S-formylglutathione hydrolase FrmB
LDETVVVGEVGRYGGGWAERSRSIRGFDRFFRSGVAEAAATLSGWPGTAALAICVVALGAVVGSGLVDQLSLDSLSTVFPVVAVAALGVAAGAVGRGWRWWCSWGLSIATVTTLAVVWAHSWVANSGLAAEHYPPTFLLWVWVALWALGVAATGWWTGGVAVRAVRALAAPLAVAAAFLLINMHYGYWPTVGVLLDRPVPGQVAAPTVYQPRPSDDHLVDADTRLALPAMGRYGPAAIPGRQAAFDAASARLWLPPAYFDPVRPPLPVLLMLTGRPGAAQDWAMAGQVVPIANAWARTHGGVAPVMVFLDENGRSGRDTECVNGPQGDAYDYLTEVVPAWIESHLGLHPGNGAWGVVGYSEGGTCALELSMNDPIVYGSFLDISGDLGPNLGSPAFTFHNLFGSSEMAYRLFEPSVVLSTHRYQGVRGWFAAGASDHDSTVTSQILYRLAAQAGMSVRLYKGAGGHTWGFARQSFAHVFPALTGEIGCQSGVPAPTARSRPVMTLRQSRYSGSPGLYPCP